MSRTCGCGCRHGTSATPVDAGHMACTAAWCPRIRWRPPRGGRPRPPTLQRFGIDACCGGSLTLAQAAAAAGVPVETVLRALEPAAPTTHEAPGLDHLPETARVDLDVREDIREGREPFARIMAAVDALPPDGVLVLRAPFEPVPLYGVLAAGGSRTGRNA